MREDLGFLGLLKMSLQATWADLFMSGFAKHFVFWLFFFTKKRLNPKGLPGFAKKCFFFNFWPC